MSHYKRILRIGMFVCCVLLSVYAFASGGTAFGWFVKGFVCAVGLYAVFSAETDNS